jgi:hypothetical protein
MYTAALFVLLSNISLLTMATSLATGDVGSPPYAAGTAAISTAAANTSSGDELKTLCKQLFRKEIIHPPTNYVKGDDVTAHIHKIKEYFILAEITSEEDQVNVFMNTLDVNLQKEMKMTKGYADHAKEFKKVMDIFERICQSKKAAITPLLRLLEMKQLPNQHVEEFVREIRIRAFDVIYDLPEDKREELMIKCFINGLRNRILSTALEFLSPKTLDEAMKMVKKEDKNPLLTSHSVDMITCSNNCMSKISELQKTVKVLQEQVERLSNRQNVRVRSYSDAVQTRNFYTKGKQSQGRFQSTQNIVGKCYNCKNAGHFAMNCPYPRRCYRCGKVGHIGRFCRMVPKTRQTVNFIEENETELERPPSAIRNGRKPSSVAASTMSEPQQELCVSNRYEVLQDEGDNFQAYQSTEEIYMVHENAKIPRQDKERSQQRRIQPEHGLIEAQVSFIEGKGPNPLPVYSKFRRDEVTNKPVVKVRLHGKQVLSLMDSGATCNIIDKRLVDCLKMKMDFQIKPSDCTIACANMSAMQSFGETVLTFSLAGTTVPMKFIIVNGLPNVDCIIGLRSMKRLGVQFDFDQDAIILNKIIIPFESVVHPSTTIPDLGNAEELNL